MMRMKVLQSRSESESAEATSGVTFVAGVVLLVFVGVVTSCALKQEDLGHGYYTAIRRQQSSSAFERYSYEKLLYLGGRRLGPVGFVSISPSGRFALYEGDGRLLLFDKGTGKTSDVTAPPVSVPKYARWDEVGAVVTVEYFEDRKADQVHLPGVEHSRDPG
jgi:hypothetical protein